MKQEFLEKLLFPFRALFSFVEYLFFFFGKMDEGYASRSILSSDIVGVMPVIGYGIFLATLADFLNLLLPLQLFNPAWELQIIGSLIDQSWGLLIGMGFICSRYFTESLKDTRLIEFLLLKFLRWFFLILGILYLFLIPMIVIDTSRMSTYITEQVAQQQNAKITQIDQIQNQRSKITNPDQLRALAQSLNMNKDDIAGLSNRELSDVIQKQLFTVKSQIGKESAIALKNQLKKLWQNSIKMIFSQVLLAFIFIFIWFKFGHIGKLD